MEKTMTARQAAKLWGISERRAAILCKEGRIPGAFKGGKEWNIPAYAKKPADGRTAACRRANNSNTLPLPVGVSDYKEAVSNYYYVDKTLMIRDFLDEIPKVSLFTRPRRFGKTLNMDMFRVFFEKTEEDTSCYFKNKKIWQCGEAYRKHQGKYPVIFLSFKDVKRDNWEDTRNDIASLLAKEFLRHGELSGSTQCNSQEALYYQTVAEKTASEGDLMSALANLSQMLHEHYGTAPIIIIDEYDTPIQQGHTKGFYDEIILFMRNFFSGGFKDNKHLAYGFMTGILRVAKESIFSGLNNLVINSVLDDKYSQYFGFTPEEVRTMAQYYHAEEKYGEICEWYDGYRFGDSEIFNPWSVINYFRNNCRPGAYWLSTGSNDIIEEVLTNAENSVMFRLESLLRKDSFVAGIDTDVVYPQIKSDPSSIYSFLLVTGYLKAVSSNMRMGGYNMCEVELPNREISFVYSKEILSKLDHIIPKSSASEIQEAIYTHDADALQNGLKKLLLRTVSFNDASSESFYHGFVLGLCAMLDHQYQVTSNRESGEGRCDIQLMPYNKNMPGILIELKAGKNCTDEQLHVLSETALAQINSRKYDTGMYDSDIKEIFKYGVAFCGKNVRIATE